MTIEQIIAQLRGQMVTKLEVRNGHAAALSALRDKDNLTDDEVIKVAELRAAKDALDAELDVMQKREAELKAEGARDEAIARLSREMHSAAPPAPRGEGGARVGAEPRTYRADNDRRGAGFLRDVAGAFFGDFTARDRLSRHMAEEKVERGHYLERAVGTGAFSGLTVPQYLTDMYAPATAALRPFADSCNLHSLPAEGMTVNISRITTASSVALQAAQNDPASETNMDDTLLTINVQTAAGQQTVSRQAVDRGTGIEEVVLDDLFRRYATTLDSTLINQAATGLSAVAQPVTYTSATPTAAELYPKILNASANLEVALLSQAMPSHAIMHSRRWYWMQSQVGSTWPFMTQPGIPTQAGGIVNATGYNQGARGMLPSGLQVIVDNNVPTNKGLGTDEDEIFVVASDECHLWEDPAAPVFIRAEQPAAASLGVVLVVYGYFAYTFSRYTNGSSKIGGTGLITPVF